MVSKVLFAGGGTGGHLYPGLAIAERLSSQGTECHFVGTTRGLEARVVPERKLPLHLIHARGLGGRPWQKAYALLQTLWGVWDSYHLLRRHRPQLVVSTGGYVCAPVLLASALRGTPVLMLEQNALPGKVNRKLGRLARCICLSFEESKKFFPASRCVVTGNPVRQEIAQAERAEALKHFGLQADRPVLLITGASQGAASLNDAVLKALAKWKDRSWSILHLCGPKHFEDVKARSREILEGSKLDYQCFAYLSEMHLAYAAAQLVVSRAGATTLAELTVRGLPCILVPYPFAAERHQDHNADALVDRGAALKLSDSAVVEGLSDCVAMLLEDSPRLSKMAEASLALGRPQALDTILALIEERFAPSQRKEDRS